MRALVILWTIVMTWGLSTTGYASDPGTIEWETILEGTVNGYCKDMAPTDTGGAVIIGSVPRRTVKSLYIGVTDANGLLTSERTIGGDLEVFCGEGIARCPDGGYIITGSRMSHAEMTAKDLYLLKTDGNTVPQWAVTSGGALDDSGRCVICTSDGGYAVAGETFSFGPYRMQVYLVKFDASGNRLWQKTYGGYLNEQATSLCETSDGGFLLAGWTQSLGEQRDDVYLIRTDANGTLLWQHALGGSGADSAVHVEPAFDGGYIVAGTITLVPAVDSDFYVIKLDAEFGIQWTRTYDAGGMETCHGLRRCRGGGYVLVGNTGVGVASDSYLVRIDSDGNRLWDAISGGSAGDDAVNVFACRGSGYTILGNTQSFGEFGQYAGYIARTGPDTLVPADFDFNGSVDLTDFARFAATWGAAPGQICYNGGCDIAVDGNPAIDAADLAEFAQYYLSGQ